LHGCMEGEGTYTCRLIYFKCSERSITEPNEKASADRKKGAVLAASHRMLLTTMQAAGTGMAPGALAVEW
jgi:hypothetical protein